MPVAYLYELAIWPQYRRQGHAEAAMRAFERRARESGCAGVALHVFGHNLKARKLYAKLGFEETNVNMYKPLYCRPVTGVRCAAPGNGSPTRSVAVPHWMDPRTA